MSEPTKAELLAQLRDLQAATQQGTTAAPIVVVAPWAGVRKALIAGVAAVAALLGGALSDGSLTTIEAVSSLGAGLVAFAATYRVSNEQPEPDESALTG
jgi:hypothetical protein